VEKTPERLRQETVKLLKEILDTDSVPRIIKTQAERLRRDWLTCSDLGPAPASTVLRPPNDDRA